MSGAADYPPLRLEPWQMTRKEFRHFVEAQSNASQTANPPLSIGDYNIPQHIQVHDRTYRFWYSSHHIRGRSMSTSNELFVAGPGIPSGTKSTAHGSQVNHDAAFVLRRIRQAEVEHARANGCRVPAAILAEFPHLAPTNPPTRVSRFECGRILAGILGQRALRPRRNDVATAARVMGVTMKVAQKALATFHDPDGGGPTARELVTIRPVTPATTTQRC